MLRLTAEEAEELVRRVHAAVRDRSREHPADAPTARYTVQLQMFPTFDEGDAAGGRR